MTKRTTEQQRARELQEAEGINYTDALNCVREQHQDQELVASEPPPAIAYALQPTAEEAAAGITAEELGVRALPADATPQQLAHAEAVWRQMESSDQTCRCSGTGCRHGERCTDNGEPSDCDGRVVHVDRHPGGMWDLTLWWDVYLCEGCGEQHSDGVWVPTIPWGETRLTENGTTTIVYEGVRHPNFPDFDEDTPEHPAGDGYCRSCGGYALYGLLCDGCRADGWTDHYGQVEEPDPDDESEWCGDCGADHEYACVC